MGYYRGDYYRGDRGGGNYYRGDPFLGGIIAGAAGKLIGRAGAAIGRAVGRGRRAVGPVLRDAAPSVVSGVAGYTIGQLPQLGPLPDLDVNKRGRGKLDPKKYRRMNPLNPKALRRALRRAEGFEKFAKRTVNALYKTVDGRRVRTYRKKGAA